MNLSPLARSARFILVGCFLVLQSTSAEASPNEDLLNAAKATDFAGVKKALDIGANVDARDQNGFTALELVSSKRDSSEIIKLLLAKGANVNSTDNYCGTALMQATALVLPPDAAKLLVAAGADV